MEENKMLREEVSQLRVLCNDVLTPGTVTFDERRVNLLKAQIHQLDRQVVLLSDCLGARVSLLHELDNSLISVANTCREYISADVKGPDVPVKRSDLTGIVTQLESCRIKINKNVDNRSNNALNQPLVYMNSYVKDDRQGQVTLLDVCRGDLQHLHLKKVAQLESKLCKLNSNLEALDATFKVYQNKDNNKANPLLLDKDLRLDATSDHFSTKIQLSCALLRDCCEELLPLSLLYPSAPWKELKKPVLSDVTIGHVMSALPRTKNSVVEQVIDALFKVTNHRIYILNQQIDSLQNELKFHQSAYTLQNQYTESLFKAVSDGYSQFESNLSNVLHSPLKDIVDAFDSLQTSASESDMRLLLETLQKHYPQLKTIKDDLEVSKDGNGANQLSNFATQFQESLNKLCQRCKRTKNRESRNIEVLQDDQAHLESQLRDVLAESAAKKDSAESKIKKSSNNEDAFTEMNENDSFETNTVRVRSQKFAHKPGLAENTGYSSNKTLALRKQNNSVSKKKDDIPYKEVTGKIGHMGESCDSFARGDEMENKGHSEAKVGQAESGMEKGEVRVKAKSIGTKRGSGKVAFR